MYIYVHIPAYVHIYICACRDLHASTCTTASVCARMHRYATLFWERRRDAYIRVRLIIYRRIGTSSNATYITVIINKNKNDNHTHTANDNNT